MSFQTGLLLLCIEVAELAAKVGQKILITERDRCGNTSVLQEAALVERDLGKRRLQSQAGVPGPAATIMKSAAIQSRMAKCTVHDMRFGNALEQLTGRDRQGSPLFGELVFAGGFGKAT